MGMRGMPGSAPGTNAVRLASDGSRITSSAVCPGMMRAPPFSKRAAVTTPLTRVCPSFISVFEIDGFVVAIEFERGRTLFLGTEAGILSATEGELVFHARAGQVDGEQAGFGAIDEVEGAREVGGLDGGRQPERDGVGDAQGVFETRGAQDGEHGSEDLLARDGVRLGDAGEDGGLDEVAVGQRAFGEAPASAGGLSAFLAADLDVAQDGLHLGLIDAGTDVDTRLHAVADLELAGALHHGGDELIVDGVFHDGAAGGGAFLAGGEEGGVDYVLDGGVKIGVGQDDSGVLAAHFKLYAEVPPAGMGVQPGADFAGAGEGHGLESGGVDQGAAQFAAGLKAVSFTGSCEIGSWLHA